MTDFSKCAARSFIALVVALGSLAVGTASASVMAIQGSFAVSPSGAATYTIPVQVPPGVAGIEPNLTLVYNSQGGNGLLGVGWSMAGLSNITRCPQTRIQDSAITGVNFSSTDRFCLDGQRLMLVSGTYGAAGSTYQTEIESFSRVTAVGAVAGGGPASFLVQTKAGLTMEYGNTPDSQVQVPGKSPLVVRTWALNKVADKKANAMTITYWKDSPGGVFNGSFGPQNIFYSMNTATGLGYSSYVSFVYDGTRSDVSSGYQAGFPFASKARLTNIKTNISGQDVLDYRLSYVQSPGTGRSRLSSITLCTRAGECLPATTMNPPPGPVQTALDVTSRTTTADTCLVTCGSWQSIDVNGDGKMDFVHLTTVAGTAKIWVSNGDGTFTVSTFTTNADTDLTNGIWQALDLDGDGLSELVHLTTNSGDYRVWKYSGYGFIVTPYKVTEDTCLAACGNWQILDVDADGLLDLVHLADNSGNYRVWKSKGNGTFSITPYNVINDTCLTTCGGWQVLDVDGDGLSDLVHLTSNPGDYRVWKSNGNGTFAITSRTTGDTSSLTNGSWQLIDVNGDGLLDMVQLTTTSGLVKVWRSKGDGTFAITPFYTSQDTDYTSGFFKVADYNGDGLPDLLHFTANLNDLRIWKSRGDGTFDISPLSTPNDPLLSAGVWQAGDIRGDGFIDFVHMPANNGQHIVWTMPRNAVTDIPDSVSNGVGAQVQWTTATLPKLLNAGDGSTAASYTMVGRTLYPAPTTMITPLRVVSTSNASDGRGGQRRSIYSYQSARTDRNERGFLGFESMQTVDAATGLVNRSYFKQNFPYLGMVDRSGQGKSPSAWSGLALTQNYYGCFIPPNPASTCAVAPGNRYFVYSSFIENYAWDVDGTALPRSRTINQNFDAYGNVGSVTSLTLTPSGGTTDHTKTVTNTYAPPDTNNWILGRLLTSTVTTSGPTVPNPVTPGSGGLATAPPPNLPPSLQAVMSTIFGLLLDD